MALRLVRRLRVGEPAAQRRDLLRRVRGHARSRRSGRRARHSRRRHARPHGLQRPQRLHAAEGRRADRVADLCECGFELAEAPPQRCGGAPLLREGQRGRALAARRGVAVSGDALRVPLQPPDGRLHDVPALEGWGGEGGTGAAVAPPPTTPPPVQLEVPELAPQPRACRLQRLYLLRRPDSRRVSLKRLLLGRLRRPPRGRRLLARLRRLDRQPRDLGRQRREHVSRLLRPPRRRRLHGRQRSLPRLVAGRLQAGERGK